MQDQALTEKDKVRLSFQITKLVYELHVFRFNSREIAPENIILQVDEKEENSDKKIVKVEDLYLIDFKFSMPYN